MSSCYVKNLVLKHPAGQVPAEGVLDTQAKVEEYVARMREATEERLRQDRKARRDSEARMRGVPIAMGWRAAREELLRLLATKGYERRETGPFTIPPGWANRHHIEFSRVTLDARGAGLVGRAVFDRARDCGADAIGGSAPDAVLIVGAVLAVAGEAGSALRGFIVREAPKEHGTQDLIAGTPLTRGMSAVLVDKGMNAGGRLEDAIAAVRATGAEVLKVVVLVELHPFLAGRLERNGIEVESLFTLGQVVTASAQECA